MQLCGKKSRRYCVKLKENICSLCCGTKRGKEIDCSLDCSIYKNSILKKNKEIVLEKVKNLYDNKYQDIYYTTDIALIASPFEKYIFETFYNDYYVNDDDLLETFRKQEGFDEYKSKLILRLCISVIEISGGAFGNRNYLELLRGQMTQTGTWANMFNDME